MNIADYTAADWIVIAGASWTILAFFVAPLIGRLLRRADRPQPVEYPPPVTEFVRWLPLLPPVPLPTTPPLSQTVPSADWFYDVPVDVLSNDAVRVLCDDIARREFS